MKKKLAFILFAIFALLCPLTQAAPRLVPISDNERVVHVVGTPFHHAYYQHLLERHLLLRFAHRGLIFRRVKVQREHLESFSQRTDKEILIHKPTLVVIQAGLDDLICRAQSAYAPKMNFAWYPVGLETIVSKCKAANAKVVVCSVHPWDNGSTKDNLIFPMDGMKGMVDAAREISAKHGAYFADIFTEAIGWPGIGSPASRKFMYAPAEHERSFKLLLSQVDFEFHGSKAQIDAKNATTVAQFMRVENLKTDAEGISFTVINGPGVGPAIIKINGLTAAKYSVNIGGKKIASLSAKELEDGFDLGPALKTKADTKEFLEALERKHATQESVPEIQNYQLPAWAKLPDFEQQKAAAVQEVLAKVERIEATVREMVSPEPLHIRLIPEK